MGASCSKAQPEELKQLQQPGAQEPWPLADWMAAHAAVLWKRPLDHVVLPGTHDTGAFAFDPTVRLSASATDGAFQALLQACPCLIKPWTQTQVLDITGQLDIGIRFFDIRLASARSPSSSSPQLQNNNEERDVSSANTKEAGRVQQASSIWVTHTFVCVPFEAVLQQVATWLGAHPGEVVVMRLAQDWAHRHTFGPEQSLEALQLLDGLAGHLVFRTQQQQQRQQQQQQGEQQQAEGQPWGAGSAPATAAGRKAYEGLLPMLGAMVSSGQRLLILADPGLPLPQSAKEEGDPSQQAGRCAQGKAGCGGQAGAQHTVSIRGAGVVPEASKGRVREGGNAGAAGCEAAEDQGSPLDLIYPVASTVLWADSPTAEGTLEGLLKAIAGLQAVAAKGCQLGDASAACRAGQAGGGLGEAQGMSGILQWKALPQQQQQESKGRQGEREQVQCSKGDSVAEYQCHACAASPVLPAQAVGTAGAAPACINRSCLKPHSSDPDSCAGRWREGKEGAPQVVPSAGNYSGRRPSASLTPAAGTPGQTYFHASFAVTPTAPSVILAAAQALACAGCDSSTWGLERLSEQCNVLLPQLLAAPGLVGCVGAVCLDFPCAENVRAVVNATVQACR